MSAADSIDWDRLVATMRPRLQRVARSVLDDEHEADDAAQEALLAAWSGIGRLRDVGAFEAWIVRIARNIALDGVRRRLRAPCTTPLETEDVEERRVGPPDAPLQFEDTLDALPATQRRALRHHLRGLSIAEAARRQRISVGAAKTRLSRARNSVRRRVVA
jgi:RNA polymerase sigma-70 factor (ECF subfamily)